MYHLDSFIIYISGESKGRERGKAGHYICFKYLNQQWFCFNDDSVYTCDFPNVPMHVYMAFYRPMPTIGCQYVKDLNVSNVAHLSKHEVTLMFEQRPMATHKSGRITGKNTQNSQVVEGNFIKNKSNESFLSKAMLRPKLITATSTPTRRKKAESDMEYVPDNDEDTQDTEEDAILERTTVREHPNKGLFLLASLGICITVMSMNLHYVRLLNVGNKHVEYFPCNSPILVNYHLQLNNRSCMMSLGKDYLQIK